MNFKAIKIVFLVTLFVSYTRGYYKRYLRKGYITMEHFDDVYRQQAIMFHHYKLSDAYEHFIATDENHCRSLSIFMRHRSVSIGRESDNTLICISTYDGITRLAEPLVPQRNVMTFIRSGQNPSWPSDKGIFYWHISYKLYAPSETMSYCKHTNTSSLPILRQEAYYKTIKTFAERSTTRKILLGVKQNSDKTKWLWYDNNEEMEFTAFERLSMILYSLGSNSNADLFMTLNSDGNYEVIPGTEKLDFLCMHKLFDFDWVTDTVVID